MKNKGGSAKTRLMFWSWLGGLAVVLMLAVIAVFAVENGRTEMMFQERYLQLVLAASLGYSAWWMRFSWVRMVEGAYLHAEYGGTGNLLQRIIFRDREPWRLSQPLPLPLEFKSKSGCVLYVSVWENFLGANKIMYRMINMYTGENVRPWDDDPDGPRGHY